VAVLTVDYQGVAEDPVGGAGALWQCWTGTAWEPTHQILRPFSSGHGETRYIEPGTEPTVPAIGLPVPNSYRVVVPDVPPGLYRIADEIWVDGEGLAGFEVVIVEGAVDSD
jgi:hypothetical protein